MEQNRNIKILKKDYQKFLDDTNRKDTKSNKKFYKNCLSSYIIEFYGIEKYHKMKSIIEAV